MRTINLPLKLNSFNLTKRQKFVIYVVFLSIGLFILETFGVNSVGYGIVLSILTDLLLYFSLRQDIKGSFYYPILILPFLYTMSFSFFHLLFPSRLLSKIFITGLYAFGLYSLFLTQNIFAISSIRTINLLRSARIISFILTILVLFFITNVIFSIRLPVLLMCALISLTALLLAFQSFWSYSLNKSELKEIVLYSLANAFAIFEISLILAAWPVDSTIYSITVTGMFYAFSGLSHAWFEQRLFKGLLWEYVWVGFLSILVLIFFSKWGV